MLSYDFFHHELRRYPKHVAFLFDGNKLIAMSTNSWGKHAEMGLLPYLQRERYQKVYVKRISDGGTCMSRPCVRCSISLKHMAPKLRVFYTNKIGEWVEDSGMDSIHTSRKDSGQASVGYRVRYHRAKCKNIYK
jgi:hypothetical protein